LLRAPGTNQNKLYNSNWKTSPSSIGMKQDSFGASPVMPHSTFFSGLKVHASSMTTRRMAEKGFGYTNSTMVSHYNTLSLRLHGT
jgi:hypothetical protein